MIAPTAARPVDLAHDKALAAIKALVIPIRKVAS